jgi:hypothetical protein
VPQYAAGVAVYDEGDEAEAPFYFKVGDIAAPGLVDMGEVGGYKQVVKADDAAAVCGSGEVAFVYAAEALLFAEAFKIVSSDGCGAQFEIHGSATEGGVVCSYLDDEWQQVGGLFALVHAPGYKLVDGLFAGGGALVEHIQAAFELFPVLPLPEEGLGSNFF